MVSDTLSQDEAAAWVALSLVGRLDVPAALRLIRAFGGVEEALGAPLTDLARLIGMPAAEEIAAAARGAHDDEVEGALAWLSDVKHARLLTIADPDFPGGLVAAGAAPLVLYAYGPAELLARRPLLALCGTEDPDEEGLRNAEDFGRAAAKAGAVAAALMTRGVSAAALSGALSAPGALPPAAVLATGCARAIRGLEGLQRRILDAGGLLLSAETPQSGRTEESAARARGLLAAAAPAFLLVEAPLRDPSVDAARRAAEAGATVGAVPGSIHAPLAKGGNRIIREGALLVETCADFGLG